MSIADAISHALLTGKPVTLTPEEVAKFHKEFVEGIKPEIDRLRAEVFAAQSESAVLRERVADLLDRHDRLRAENAELKRVLKDKAEEDETRRLNAFVRDLEHEECVKIEAALREQVERLEKAQGPLLALARRCLWIAYAWNDHNFDAAHICAKRQAVAAGIASFEQANDWIEDMDAALAQAQEGKS